MEQVARLVVQMQLLFSRHFILAVAVVCIYVLCLSRETLRERKRDHTQQQDTEVL